MIVNDITIFLSNYIVLLKNIVIDVYLHYNTSYMNKHHYKRV